MPKEFHRSERIAAQIQREIATLIQHEMRDPRVGWVTVSKVIVSKDLSHAKIYVTTFQAEVSEKEVVTLLNRSAKFFRFHLGKAMRLRVVPELKFILDESLKEAQEIKDLMRKIDSKDNE